jgi:hypothetical protein
MIFKRKKIVKGKAVPNGILCDENNFAPPKFWFIYIYYKSEPYKLTTLAVQKFFNKYKKNMLGFGDSLWEKERGTS